MVEKIFEDIIWLYESPMTTVTCVSPIPSTTLILQLPFATCKLWMTSAILFKINTQRASFFPFLFFFPPLSLSPNSNPTVPSLHSQRPSSLPLSTVKHSQNIMRSPIPPLDCHPSLSFSITVQLMFCQNSHHRSPSPPILYIQRYIEHFFFINLM